MDWAINCGGVGTQEAEERILRCLNAFRLVTEFEREVIELWLEVAKEECKEILDFLWSERGIALTNKGKAEEAIAILLDDFSVAAVFYLLWFGAARTSDAIARGQVDRVRAPYYALQVSRNRAKDILQGSAEARRFNRNPLIPRSEISHVLFDTFLGIGELGFHEPINRTLLRSGPKRL